MSQHSHWPRMRRHLRNGHVSRALPLMLGIIGFSLFASAAQIVDFAVSGSPVELQVSQSDPVRSVESANANFEAGILATSFVELPPASVDAISL